ncbi:MAG TPA: homocysteine S-methyltransferase family protein, partial [Novosphingobium sp.]|nr:homocysteine S-methyltransferase family protein [Novosphingobium sp.]
EALADRAGKLAYMAALDRPHIRVAGSLPPLFGSYRPDLFDAAAAPARIAPLIAGLAPHVDLWLAETLSAIEEAQVVANALADRDKPLWLSFTLEDEAADAATAPRLRSGEPVALAARFAQECGAEALLFNCSQPEVMEAALRAAQAEAPGLTLGVYANAFPPQPKDASANETLHDLRADLDPEGYLGWVRRWVECGARIVGGCCGIGPDHIAAIAASGLDQPRP